MWSEAELREVIYPFTPTSDQDIISPSTISIQYQEDRWWESRRISIMGLLVDPIPNSLN